jgi:2-aminobenzoate-CoA ligase
MNGTAYLDTFANDNLPPREQWPELLFELDELAYPERINCAVELLDAMVARGHGASIAIRGASLAWTYADLLETVDRIAGVLRTTLALVPGNRVLLRGANNPMMAACVLAVWKAGCVAVPTMPLLRAKELGTIMTWRGSTPCCAPPTCARNSTWPARAWKAHRAWSRSTTASDPVRSSS